MLILTERYPQKSIYYLGAKLLYLLNEKNMKFTLMELFHEFKKNIPEIELKKFMLILDWLYLLGTIKITKDGMIVKCS